MFFQGLAWTPYPGPGSSSYRSAGDPPAVGHQPASPKQKQSAQTFFQNNTSAGVGVAGREFPQPAPRGPGVPTGTKKARFGSKKGPRQTGQAATTEYQD